MDILRYTEDHQQFRRRLRAFCEQEVIPHVDQWEARRRVPREAWRKMGRAGFLCPTVAETYGGMGGDFIHALIVAEELSRTVHTGLAATLHSDVVVPYIESFAAEPIKQRFLPGCVNGDIVTAVAMTEPNAGSDLAGMQTTAVEEGDTVVLNGTKTFISNGLNCDLLVLAAKDPEQSNPHQAISLYLVEADTPGFKKGNPLHKMGWHSQDTAELFFTNCRVPVANRLGEQGAGFLMMMEKLQQERLACVMGAVAAAERIVEYTIDHCKRTLVNGRPLCRAQAVQFALVEMSTEVKLGRTFMEKLITDHMEKQNIVVEVSMAKYWCTDAVHRIASRALDLLGRHGMLEACPMVRAFRDTRVMSIFAGTNEIMKGIAAKFMGL
ncbi:acyl-CoA dehydrogenase family protein [Desulfatitalea alkaliphila]|uniref:Acyl-[acyl-carrier-protein] dehydrogenase MbtN n=1 Tax=Desulfatitalea alkaliphila TaxID=2929485 RepID=A0AA41UJL0_9BACT|nr:acyl-CoA dehydrogenase family protein [Desulfatitalea alkaliphila]MCJ8499486.1 acyl-CoA dehydrogenase family protein [Desulfatitalea alkaliphila]